MGWELQRQKTKPGENVPDTTTSWEFNSLLSPGFSPLISYPVVSVVSGIQSNGMGMDSRNGNYLDF